MIRWYDYVVALLAADFVFANAMVAFTAPTWWVQILGAVGVYFVWELWDSTYCPWRKHLEEKR